VEYAGRVKPMRRVSSRRALSPLASASRRGPPLALPRSRKAPGLHRCGTGDVRREARATRRLAAKHHPFVHFNDLNGWNGATFTAPARCGGHVVDHSELDPDIASGHLPDHVFITPDLEHNIHNGTVAEGDAWLAV
jgi:hypothetical protein